MRFWAWGGNTKGDWPMARRNRPSCDPEPHAARPFASGLHPPAEQLSRVSRGGLCMPAKTGWALPGHFPIKRTFFGVPSPRRDPVPRVRQDLPGLTYGLISLTRRAHPSAKTTLRIIPGLPRKVCDLAWTMSRRGGLCTPATEAFL